MTNEFAIKVLTELKGYGDKFANIGYDRKEALDLAIRALEQQPRMGEWIFVHPLQEDDEGAYMCSCCNYGDWNVKPKRYIYCPFCGARMNGGGASD